MKKAAYSISGELKRRKALFVHDADILHTIGTRLISLTIARSVATEPRCEAEMNFVTKQIDDIWE